MRKKSERELDNIRRSKPERPWLYCALALLLFSLVIHVGQFWEDVFITNMVGLTFIPGTICLIVWSIRTPAPYQSYPDHFGS